MKMWNWMMKDETFLMFANFDLGILRPSSETYTAYNNTRMRNLEKNSTLLLHNWHKSLRGRLHRCGRTSDHLTQHVCAVQCVHYTLQHMMHKTLFTEMKNSTKVSKSTQTCINVHNRLQKFTNAHKSTKSLHANTWCSKAVGKAMCA